MRRAGALGAVVAGLLAVGSVAQAAPILSSPIVVAQVGENVLCFATNVSANAHHVTVSIANAAGTVVAKDEKPLDPGKTIAVGWDHPGNFPGFYLCQVDEKGAARRAFRARIKTQSDGMVVE